MLISGIRYAGERKHSVPERIESKQQNKSEIDFKELLDLEIKKLESSKTDQSRMIPIQGK